jgi:hypothetical protein
VRCRLFHHFVIISCITPEEPEMTTLHSILVWLHIASGAVALVLFWVPALAKKGSPLHVRAGRYYRNLMYMVSVTAFVASLIVLADPIGIRRPGEILAAAEAERLAGLYRMFSLFLLMLSVLVFTSIRHGLLALRERATSGVLATPQHRSLIGAMAFLALVVGFLGIRHAQILLIVFAGLGLSGAWSMFRDTRIEQPSRQQLVVAHLSGLIGSGIGAYTAFFAFGGDRLFGDLLPGQWQVIPWVLPAIIGTIAINRLKRSFAGRTRTKAVASNA